MAWAHEIYKPILNSKTSATMTHPRPTQCKCFSYLLIALLATSLAYAHQDSSIGENILNASHLGSTVEEFRQAIQGHGSFISLQILDHYYSTLGPNTMLDVFEEDPFCHSIAHNLGNIILLRTKSISKSMEICARRCDEGCFHGILEGIFKDYEVKNNSAGPYSWQSHITKEEFREKLPNVCFRPEFESHEFDCFHAIGHVSMFVADYDIEEAISLCRLLKNKRGVYTCVTGVYMEEMLSKKDQAKSLLYPCDTHLQFPAACFRYAFDFWKDPFDYERATLECMRMKDSVQRRGCMHGVGFASFMIVYNRPDLLQRICSIGSYTEELMCIEGAAGKLNTHYPKKQRETCLLIMDVRLRNACINARNLGNGKDPKLYYSDESQTLFSWMLSLLRGK